MISTGALGGRCDPSPDALESLAAPDLATATSASGTIGAAVFVSDVAAAGVEGGAKPAGAALAVWLGVDPAAAAGFHELVVAPLCCGVLVERVPLAGAGLFAEATTIGRRTTGLGALPVEDVAAAFASDCAIAAATTLASWGVVALSAAVGASEACVELAIAPVGSPALVAGVADELSAADAVVVVAEEWLSRWPWAFDESLWPDGAAGWLDVALCDAGVVEAAESLAPGASASGASASGALALGGDALVAAPFGQ